MFVAEVDQSTQTIYALPPTLQSHKNVETLPHIIIIIKARARERAIDRQSTPSVPNTQNHMAPGPSIPLCTCVHVLRRFTTKREQIRAASAT
jgi:hypothetical protein